MNYRRIDSRECKEKGMAGFWDRTHAGREGIGLSGDIRRQKPINPEYRTENCLLRYWKTENITLHY